MRLMRDDEYEPLRMNHEYPPIAENRLRQPRRAERKNKPGQGRKPKFTEAELRKIARQTGRSSEVMGRD